MTSWEYDDESDEGWEYCDLCDEGAALDDLIECRNCGAFYCPECSSEGEPDYYCGECAR